jgi:hypothetical protein
MGDGEQNEKFDRLVPFNEVCLDRDGLGLEIAVPDYVNDGEVYVNVDAVRQTLKFCGIRNLIICGGEADDDEPQVGGTSGGEADATVGRAASAEKQVDLDRHGYPLFATSMWSDVVVRSDFKKLKKLVGEHEGGVRSADAWGEELNRLLEDSIVAAGRRNLLWSTSLDKFISGVAVLAMFARWGVPESTFLVVNFVYGITLANLIIAAGLAMTGVADARLNITSCFGYDLGRLAVHSVTAPFEVYCHVLKDDKEEGGEED